MASPSTSSGPASPASRKVPRATKRGKLRNATFINPSTNQRVRRQITLRNPANLDGPSPDLVQSYQAFERRWSTAGTFDTAFHNTKVSLKLLWRWLRSPTGQGVLKCSFAYLLGCMGTLFPPLASFLGHQDGKHVVATIVTYFHPARSAGSMIEAVIFMLVAVAYAVVVSVLSMAVSVLCESQLDLIELGYAIVLIVFVGGGLGFIGWVKQKFGMPLVNVACSLASLSIITVLTKENAVQTGVFENTKIVQNLKMLTLALLFTVSVNMLIWPVSARRELRQSMIISTDALGDLLTTITHSFLIGSEVELKSSEFQNTAKRYKSIFLQLTKNLQEAKLEHYVVGRECEYELEARLVRSMQRLSQSIGGLRSAAMTQFTLLRETSNVGSSTPRYGGRPDSPLYSADSVSQTMIRTKPDRFAVLAAIDEDPNESSDAEVQEHNETVAQSAASMKSVPESAMLPTVRTPSEIFSRFILQLGPSMKSLAYTLSQLLNDLPFGDAPDFKIVINENFGISLTDALALYSEARKDALEQLYRSKDLSTKKSESIEADFEEVAASCGYFSFSLQDFAEEMQNYLGILEDLKEEMDNSRRRSWSWLKFWHRWTAPKRDRGQGNGSESSSLLDQGVEHDPVSEIEGQSKAIPNVTTRQPRSPANENFTFDDVTAGLSRALKFFERDDIRFAVKVGIGAALWALLSFIPSTRPFYAHWRGEWGLLSFMLVCSMTVGASNTTGYARFLGTLIGAALAVIVWLICQGNVFALAFCSWVVSVHCFYLIVAAGRAPFGRFTLLTYNLSALYAYSLSIKDSDDDDDEGGVNPIISEIALHRVVAVLGGVVWGLIITRMIWPISARQKFKDGLSALWLRMGLIWGRDPLSAVLDNGTSNAYMNFREELALQRFLTRLDSLRTSASSEYELSGPFPSATYGKIMDSTNIMLDAFHSMNLIIKKDLRANAAERAILDYTCEQRKDLGGRISHLFQVLASSMKLEFPVGIGASGGGTLPGVGNSRDRLLARLWSYRKQAQSEAEAQLTAVEEDDDSSESGSNGEGSSGKSRSNGSGKSQNGSDPFEYAFVNKGQDSTGLSPRVVATKDEDYALIYAYALVTGQLAEEIRKVEREIENLFGVVDEELLQLY